MGRPERTGVDASGIKPSRWDRRSLLIGFLSGVLLIGVLMGLGAIRTHAGSGVETGADICSLAATDPQRIVLSMVGRASCNLVQPLFSPGAGDEIISMIRSARTSVDVEMYVFTDANLARELTDAAGRGVRVRVILEPRVDSSSLDTIAQAMQTGGVSVRWANVRYALTHTKMMIIDGKRALVGSINFSKAAQNKNREAALEVSGPVLDSLTQLFETDWADASERRNDSASIKGE